MNVRTAWQVDEFGSFLTDDGEALRLAIHEAIRTRKAAGVPSITERRINP